MASFRRGRLPVNHAALRAYPNSPAKPGFLHNAHGTPHSGFVLLGEIGA